MELPVVSTRLPHATSDSNASPPDSPSPSLEVFAGSRSRRSSRAQLAVRVADIAAGEQEDPIRVLSFSERVSPDGKPLVIRVAHTDGDADTSTAADDDSPFAASAKAARPLSPAAVEQRDAEDGASPFAAFASAPSALPAAEAADSPSPVAQLATAGSTAVAPAAPAPAADSFSPFAQMPAFESFRRPDTAAASTASPFEQYAASTSPPFSPFAQDAASTDSFSPFAQYATAPTPTAAAGQPSSMFAADAASPRPAARPPASPSDQQGSSRRSPPPSPFMTHAANGHVASTAGPLSPMRPRLGLGRQESTTINPCPSIYLPTVYNNSEISSNTAGPGALVQGTALQRAPSRSDRPGASSQQITALHRTASGTAGQQAGSGGETVSGFAECSTSPFRGEAAAMMPVHSLPDNDDPVNHLPPTTDFKRLQDMNCLIRWEHLQASLQGYLNKGSYGQVRAAFSHNAAGLACYSPLIVITALPLACRRGLLGLSPASTTSAAQVFKGVYLSADIALKMTNVDFGVPFTIELLATYLRETNLQRRLSYHPNIVRFIGACCYFQVKTSAPQMRWVQVEFHL